MWNDGEKVFWKVLKYCSSVILAHYSRIFKSWRFHVPLLLWPLILSCFHRFLIWFSGPVSLVVFLGSFSELNVHPCFILTILVDFYQDYLNTLFHSSFLQIYEICQYHVLKNSPTPWRSHLLLVLCFWVVVQCHLSCKHGVCYDPKSSVSVSSDLMIFSQHFTGLSKCCAANFKQASACFFFSKKSLVWWVCIQAVTVECITYCFLWNKCTF